MSFNTDSPILVNQILTHCAGIFFAKEDDFIYKSKINIFKKQHTFLPAGVPLPSEAYAFMWKGTVFYHPELSNKEALKRWEILTLSASLNSEWEDLFLNWIQPISREKDIFKGILNACSNLSKSSSDWEQLLPPYFGECIEFLKGCSFITNNPNWLFEEQITNFKEKNKEVFNLLNTRMAKRLILKDAI